MFAEQLRSSVLLPAPKNSSFYRLPNNQLNKKQLRKKKIFGLRMAPLDPEIWGILYKDRTENRNLVPMRPYYLRVSEDIDFNLSSISLSFAFQKTGKKLMRKDRASSTAAIDIGLAGEFEASSIFERPKTDREYFIRLTAAPALQSGIWYRSLRKLVLLKAAEFELETGKDYKLELKVNQNQLDVRVNDNNFVSYAANSSLSKGLVNLRTAWLPIDLKGLKLVGQLNKHSGVENISLSGRLSNET